MICSPYRLIVICDQSQCLHGWLSHHQHTQLLAGMVYTGSLSSCWLAWSSPAHAAASCLGLDKSTLLLAGLVFTGSQLSAGLVFTSAHSWHHAHIAAGWLCIHQDTQLLAVLIFTSTLSCWLARSSPAAQLLAGLVFTSNSASAWLDLHQHIQLLAGLVVTSTLGCWLAWSSPPHSAASWLGLHQRPPEDDAVANPLPEHHPLFRLSHLRQTWS